MGKKFKVKSPIGSTVICSDEQWSNHVVESHPIMKNNVEAVKDTLQDPDVIYSGNKKNRKVYFKTTSRASYSAALQTKVVTETLSSKHEEVITAFPNKGIKGGIADEIYHK